jgi:hypothetical protein
VGIVDVVTAGGALFLIVQLGSVLVLIGQAEPSTESVVSVFDRADSSLVEWLCSAEGAAWTTTAFGKEA